MSKNPLKKKNAVLAKPLEKQLPRSLDKAVLEPDDDEIHGGAGDDEIRGGAGDDEIRGGAGDDEIRGQEGDDEIRGGAGDGGHRGGAGDDEILVVELVMMKFAEAKVMMRLKVPVMVKSVVETGDDEIRGGAGDDGQSKGDDWLLEQGDDEIRGGAGNDALNGGASDDTVSGEQEMTLFKEELE